MKQKRFRLGALVAILLLGVVLLAYAANVGSEQDPLISMSYLQESYTEELMEQVDQKLEAQSEELRKQVDAAVQEVQGQQGTQTELETFEVVTLSKGQTLYGDIGCEVMLRVGTASCVAASSPGLVDSTGGGTLNQGGSLEKNHLYLMTIEERGVCATAETVKLLVRGGYTLG